MIPTSWHLVSQQLTQLAATTVSFDLQFPFNQWVLYPTSRQSRTCYKGSHTSLSPSTSLCSLGTSLISKATVALPLFNVSATLGQIFLG